MTTITRLVHTILANDQSRLNFINKRENKANLPSSIFDRLHGFEL